jgi:hypothetical protein
MTDHICEVCGKSFNWGADEDSKIVDAERESWTKCRENAHWKLTFHIKQAHPGHGFYCGRRREGSILRDDTKDYWHKRNGYRACGYCGSMHPEDLFAAVEATVRSRAPTRTTSSTSTRRPGSCIADSRNSDLPAVRISNDDAYIVGV